MYDMKYDLEKSKKEAPKREIIGADYVDRLLVPLADCEAVIADQVRYRSTDLSNQRAIQQSLENNGWFHDENPPIVEWNDFMGKYLIKDGWTRAAALTALGVKEWIVDVVKFHSPQDQLRTQLVRNILLKPSKGNTHRDYVESIAAAVQNNNIQNNHSKIKEFIDSIEGVSTKQGLKILVDVMNKSGTATKFSTYSANGSHVSNNIYRFADQVLKVPHSGKNKYDAVGYVTGEGGGSRMTFANMFKNFNKLLRECGPHSVPPIYVFGYLLHPKGDTEQLAKDRFEWVRSWYNTMSEFETCAKHMTGSSHVVKTPFIFGGFYPQDQTKDPLRGGVKMEDHTSIVNHNGENIEWRTYYSQLGDSWLKPSLVPSNSSSSLFSEETEETKEIEEIEAA